MKNRNVFGLSPVCSDSLKLLKLRNEEIPLVSFFHFTTFSLAIRFLNPHFGVIIINHRILLRESSYVSEIVAGTVSYHMLGSITRCDFVTCNHMGASYGVVIANSFMI